MTQKGANSEITLQQWGNQNTEEKIYGIGQYMKKIWDLGIITYGGPMSHIGIFRKRLVQEMNCIKDDKFVELLTICQSIPGPTSTQLLTAISMYATASFKGGLLAFIIFSLPAFIAIYMAVLYLQQFNNQFLQKYVLPGFRVVAVAVILQAFVGLFKKIANQILMIAIVIVSAVAYYFKPQTLVILIQFAISAIIGYFFKKSSQSNQTYNIPSRFNSKIYGFKNFVLFLIILAVTTFGLPYFHDKLLIVFSLFYKIGALVIGGGHVILPIMNSQFSSYKFFSQQQFYNGFSLISILPGPMFNLCVYVGGITTKNIWGSLAAFSGLYLPCFFFLLFILPYWETYRKQTKIKNVISAVCSASIGLILVAAVILYQKQLAVRPDFLWFLLVTLIIVLSYGLLHYNFSIIIVFLLGDLGYIGALKVIENYS